MSNAIQIHYTQQKNKEFKAKILDLEKKLENQTMLKEYSFKRETILTDKITELSRQRFRHYNEEEYIIFMDDGDDFPDSMMCPVVMSADKFRELFYAREKSE